MSSHPNTFEAPIASHDADAKIDWKAFVEVLPAGLELMAPSSVMRQAFNLISNASNTRRYQSLLNDARSSLQGARIPLLIEERRARPEIALSELNGAQRQALGQRALELYFAQIFRNDAALIDLWSSRFGVNATGHAVWMPRPIYVRWDADFLGAVRDVYAGFFAENDGLFRAALHRLGLGAAGAVLLRHLGEGAQRSVRFTKAGLQSTLRDIVDLRSPRDPRLHHNFMAFGLYLASLHELLASLGLAFDVRHAYTNAQVNLPLVQ